MSLRRVPTVTEEQYVAAERAADTRSELVDGVVVAMGGASERHVSIVTNLVVALGTRLRGRPCRVYSTDLRVRVGLGRMYAYPDVVVVCGERQFADDQRDTLVNPTLIVEVLSESTEDYDRGKKFEYYRRAATLVEYVTVAQAAPHVEHHVRQADDRWMLEETDRLEDRLELSSIGCDVTLAEIYDGIDFGGDEGGSAAREPGD